MLPYLTVYLKFFVSFDIKSLGALYFWNYIIRRSAAIANITRVRLFEEEIMPMKIALEATGSHVAASLLLIRKERQTKVILESKERGGRRPIIIREEIHSRADSHRRYLPKVKRDAPFCTSRKNFQSPLLSLLTPLTRQWLHYKHRAKKKNLSFFPSPIKLPSFFLALHETLFAILICHVYLSKYVCVGSQL